MLHGLRRNIVFFDFAMRPHPANSDPIPLQDLLPGLRKKVNDEEAYYLRDNERRVLQLSRIKRTKTDDGTEVLVLLLSFGDRDRADPGFYNFDTKKNRIIKKEPNEGGALSARLVN